MDNAKTGALIAARRKELNLTQKVLAEKLHISDRTVSKWERGAGFPDISLLEPLADALGISILDLVQGEQREEAVTEVTVRSVIWPSASTSERPPVSRSSPGWRKPFCC